MIPYAFSYARAKSLDDAAKLFAASGDAKFLAGGQTLIPTMKLRLANPAQLIDISGIGELSFLRVDADKVVIGAGVKHAAVAESADVRRSIPALAELAGMIGDPALRHMGTLGGSIANNDPAADYPAAVLGLGATVKTNRREIAADAYFTGMFSTALEDGELVTSVSFPVPRRAAYMKFRNPASRYALVGVFVTETKDGTRVAVTGAAASVFRQRDMEAALTKNFRPETVASIKHPPDGLNSDLHASAEYRAHLITVMAKRAIAAALARSL